MSEQTFKHKPFTYLSKLFAVAVLSFNTFFLGMGTNMQQSFPMFNLLITGMLIFVLVMGLWELNTPLIKIKNNMLSMRLSMLSGVKTADLTKVEQVDVNKRKTRMTLTIAGQDFIIPLAMVKNADKTTLMKIVNEGMP